MEHIVPTGAIKHGKSTVTQLLAKRLPGTVATYETSQVINEVVTPFKAALDPSEIHRLDSVESLSRWRQKLAPILKQIVRVSIPESELIFTQEDYQKHPEQFAKYFEYAKNLQARPSLLTQPVTQENKHLQRPILQAVGATGLQIDGGIWFKEIIRRSRGDAVRSATYCIMNALRDPAELPAIRTVDALILEVVRPGYDEQDLNDPTESRRREITPDVTIVNNGTLAELEQTTERFVADYALGKSRLERTYVAKQ